MTLTAMAECIESKPRHISHIRVSPAGAPISFQSNEEHSRGVAELAKRFAEEFGMGSWGYALGMLHDKGKEKNQFQEYIQDVNNIPGHTHYTHQGKQHAYVGALLARRIYGKQSLQLFCNPIASHHGGLHDYCDLEVLLDQELPPEVTLDNHRYPLNKPPFQLSADELHHLSRMLFSCLVDADYLDTEAFMNPGTSLLRGCSTPLSQLLPTLEHYMETLQSTAADTNVNRVRRRVLERCAAMADGEKGFYSLTVPTGGGKTLSSLLWAMRHAVKNHLRRIIIAIPYTSIIVQTASLLKRIFGEENVLEHHSSFDPSSIQKDCLRQKALLATENWDYPIVVTTNVQLFESMFSNRPSICRKLHNIASSVILLDEVQTLPTGFLQPIVDALKTYRHLFGISVLFTTASQPILSGEIRGCHPQASFPAIDHIREIIPPDLRLQDRLRRVRLEIDDRGKSYDEVAGLLVRHPRVLCIVNTRRDAKELYERLPEEGVRLHLSRMMCPRHVAENIEKIRKVLADSTQKVVRVIATQLVEAGVDIDFPVVFRQAAGLDAVLQAAGRCNREGRLGLSTTYVFSLDKEHPLPVGHLRSANDARLAVDTAKDWFAPETMTEYFRQLYSRQTSFDKKDIRALTSRPNGICFATAARQFRLIEDDGVPVIINREDSMTLVEQLKSEGFTYPLMKKLAGYTVSIHQQDFNLLAGYGAIDEVIEGVYVASDKAQYDNNIGLRTDNHWMEELIII